MITDAQIARINELSKKSKSQGLTEDEAAEQQKLRRLYIQSFKDNLSSILDNTVIQKPDGTKEKLTRKPKQ